MRASLKSQPTKLPTHLVNRNVMLGTHRTSLRMAPEFWSAAEDICHREDCTIGELVERAAAVRKGTRRRTSDVRCFILTYYRAAATEAGHAAAGHGERNKVVS